ncbi:hypothetical protein BKA80DRAFT_72194 [Phyllosticta citrichinensis]
MLTKMTGCHSIFVVRAGSRPFDTPLRACYSPSPSPKPLYVLSKVVSKWYAPSLSPSHSKIASPFSSHGPRSCRSLLVGYVFREVRLPHLLSSSRLRVCVRSPVQISDTTLRDLALVLQPNFCFFRQSISSIAPSTPSVNGRDSVFSRYHPSRIASTAM